MADALPVLIVLILHTIGLSVFSNTCASEEIDEIHTLTPCFPFLMSTMAVCTFLTQMSLYPDCFHEPPWMLLISYEVVICKYFLEMIQNCIWYPLVLFMYSLLEQISLKLTCCKETGDKLQFRILSYVMSFAFFATALYVTDFLTACGFTIPEIPKVETTKCIQPIVPITPPERRPRTCGSRSSSGSRRSEPSKDRQKHPRKTKTKHTC